MVEESEIYQGEVSRFLSAQRFFKNNNHGSVIKNPPASTGDAGSIPGSGRSPGEGNGNPLQYSCLENPMDKGVWRAKVHGVGNGSDTR